MPFVFLGSEIYSVTSFTNSTHLFDFQPRNRWSKLKEFKFHFNHLLFLTLKFNMRKILMGFFLLPCKMTFFTSRLHRHNYAIQGSQLGCLGWKQSTINNQPPSSIQCRGWDSRPLGCEPSALTTRQTMAPLLKIWLIFTNKVL